VVGASAPPPPTTAKSPTPPPTAPTAAAYPSHHGTLRNRGFGASVGPIKRAIPPITQEPLPTTPNPSYTTQPFATSPTRSVPTYPPDQSRSAWRLTI